MSSPAPVPAPRTQAQRSAHMKRRLVDAAIASLVEQGYARTPIVEVCRRAGVTRGAFHHHFESLPALLIEVLERLYAELRESPPREPEPASLEEMVRRGWRNLRRSEFKAVIEIWLAARNDPGLRAELGPAIATLSRLFEPAESPALARLLGNRPELAPFYRLVAETMIGLALGRATSVEGGAVEHESDVIELLASLARERDAR